MSGGVDSSVAASLLKEQGYLLQGAFMRTWHEEDQLHPLGECPWERDSRDARKVAETIGIPFEIINMIDFYRQYVVTPLIEGYRNGITPNPDILCNQFIKFGILAQLAKAKGCNFVATGHYCKKRKNSDGSWDIVEPVDRNKDQTYFLAYLKQDQIKSALFPLGNLNKNEVRQIARERGLLTAEKKDSQGICFLGRVKIQDFLSHYIPDKEGDIVNTAKKIVGKHRGLHNFTIGQRHGLNIPSNSDGNHYVVIGKDLATNELHVAFESENLLYKSVFPIYNLSFTNKAIPDRCKLQCRPRYRDPYQEIFFERTSHDTAIVEFKSPQRALSSGQVIAFYDEGTLLGGGLYV